MDIEPLEQQVRRVGISETARRAGIHRVSISKWIAGRSLSLDHIARIAQAVGWELVLRQRQRGKKAADKPQEAANDQPCVNDHSASDETPLSSNCSPETSTGPSNTPPA